MSQIRDYVTSVELAITTGLDRGTINHVLSYLTDIDILISLRSDDHVHRTRITNRYLWYVVLRNSYSCMKRFYMINRNRITSDHLKEITNFIYGSVSWNALRCLIEIDPQRIYDTENNAVWSDIRYIDNCIRANSVQCLDYFLKTLRPSFDVVKQLHEIILLSHKSVECMKYALDVKRSMNATDSETVRVSLCHLFYAQYSRKSKFMQRTRLYGEADWIVAIIMCCMRSNAWSCIRYLLDVMDRYLTTDEYQFIADHIPYELNTYKPSILLKYPLWFLIYILQRCMHIPLPILYEMRDSSCPDVRAVYQSLVK